MIAQIAPAVRVAIAETMGLAPGEVTVGQMVTGLRQIGFDYVFGEYCISVQKLLCRHDADSLQLHLVASTHCCTSSIRVYLHVHYII